LHPDDLARLRQAILCPCPTLPVVYPCFVKLAGTVVRKGDRGLRNLAEPLIPVLLNQILEAVVATAGELEAKTTPPQVAEEAPEQSVDEALEQAAPFIEDDTAEEAEATV
jgi:hypothetical protein